MDDRRAPDRDDAAEGAVFVPARLRAGGRPPILPGAVLLGMIAAVAVGVAGRSSGTTPIVRSEVALGSTPASPSWEVPGTTRPEARPRASARGRPVELLRLDLVRHEPHLFVHGDVFSLDAFIVVVSLEEGGRVTATRTVDMPGGSTAFLTGANPRFDVRFDLPAGAAAGRIWVRANTYDSHGDLVASMREPLRQDGAGGMDAAGR